MKWFGEPWPDPDLRAPVCEDDADRVDVPVGETCGVCGNEIAADAQGVVIPHVLTFPGRSRMEPVHLACLLANIILPPPDREQVRGP